MGPRATCPSARAPGSSCEPGTVRRVVPIDDAEFEALLEQVRDLHRLADELTHTSALIQANVRARLNWSHEAPPLPPDQSKIADDVVEVLEKPRLSSSQARALQRAFFGK